MLEFKGGNLALIQSTAFIARIEGPSGTGKTLAIMFKLHAMCEHYPGIKVRIFKETKVSLNSAIIPQFMKMIGKDHPCYTRTDPKNIETLRYPNGSDIVFGGLDDVDRVMGDNVDFIWVNEGTRGVAKVDVEYLITRFRGPKVAPYRQLLIDMNPSFPGHWLNTWEESSVLGERNVRILSRHEDNPLLHDGTDWTFDGKQYRNRLQSLLTGAALMRMFTGTWAADEGAIFEELCDKYHNRSGKNLHFDEYIVGLDWGIRDPFAGGLIGIDKSAKIAHLLNEAQKTDTATSEQAVMIETMTGRRSVYEYKPNEERVEQAEVKVLYYDPRMDAMGPRHADKKKGEPAIVEFRKRFPNLPMIPGIGGPGTRLSNLEFMQDIIRAAAREDVERWKFYIDKEKCPKAWAEYEGAVWGQDRSGNSTEDMDPKMPDHHITANYYALRSHLPEAGRAEIVIPPNMHFAQMSM